MVSVVLAVAFAVLDIALDGFVLVEIAVVEGVAFAVVSKSVIRDAFVVVLEVAIVVSVVSPDLAIVG